ncbi:MAG TPA: hypothetical protein VFL57_01335 [Bryobacteraceae bacterium]|nr:hypothetical protein [Bryobacteraceae bacterium]
MVAFAGLPSARKSPVFDDVEDGAREQGVAYDGLTPFDLAGGIDNQLHCDLADDFHLPCDRRVRRFLLRQHRLARRLFLNLQQVLTEQRRHAGQQQ